jgi:hypothetical protein
MKALVVCQSLFDNTQEIARGITGAWSDHLDGQLSGMTKAPPTVTEPFDLIVVDGPTTLPG